MGVIVSALGGLVTTIVWHYLRKLRCFQDNVADQRHGSIFDKTTILALNAEQTSKTTLCIRQAVKDYSKKYFQDKEQRHDTNVNRTKDLVDYAKKAFKALLSIQGDMKNYGEKYF